MQRPIISTNVAISADGKISTVGGLPAGWTSREDHVRLLELRETADALLVGRGTLEADRMTMIVPGKAIQPLRCVVSRSGKISQGLPLFQTSGGPIHLLITGNEEPPEFGAEVTIHRQPLLEFLDTLAVEFGVKRLHCEGGGQLINELADLDLVDEFHVTIAGHTLFGGATAPTGTGRPAEFLDASRRYEISHFDPRPDLGECFLTYSRLR